MANEEPKNPITIKNPELRSWINGEIKDGTNLSGNIPLPNIVRVEALSRSDRNRYLGTTQQFANFAKDIVRDGLKIKGLDKFYGFMKGGAPKTLTLNSTWAPYKGGSGGIDAIRSVAGGGNVSFTDVLFGSAAENASGLLRDISGISATSTGATTLNRFQSTSLGDFNISCGWYLPEQFNLCIKSLRSIMALTYPVQVSRTTSAELTGNIAKKTKETFGTENTANDVTPQVSGSEAARIQKELAELRTQPPSGNPFSEQFRQGQIDAKRKELDANINSESNKEREKSDTEKTQDNSFKTFVGFTQSIADFFGRNLTFDPMPVRCSIGQYIDIEPLVITKLSTEFSDSTFINSDGRHVPLFCYVNIHFNFWLTPQPKLQFMSLLGKEMFGNEFDLSESQNKGNQ